MIWRIIAVLAKSAVILAMVELASPFAESMGIQFRLIAGIASAISHTTAIPYKEAEVAVLFLLATALLETAQFLWDRAMG